MAPLFMKRIRKNFKLGDKVKVSKEGGWQQDFLGSIDSLRENIETQQGEELAYMVKFDEPQHDLSDNGPYASSQILTRYLTKI